MRNEAYENGNKIGYSQTSAMLTELKKCEDFAFLKVVDSIALQQSLRDLDRGFVNFFQKRAAHPVSGGRFVHPQLQPGGVSLLPDALPGRRDGLQRSVLGHLDGGTRQGAELRPCGEQGRVRELPCREPRLYKNL